MTDILKAMILKDFVDGVKDAERLYYRLQHIVKALPFVKRKQVHVALFTKVEPIHREGKCVFLPEDVLQKV